MAGSSHSCDRPIRPVLLHKLASQLEPLRGTAIIPTPFNEPVLHKCARLSNVSVWLKPHNRLALRGRERKVGRGDGRDVRTIGSASLASS